MERTDLAKRVRTVSFLSGDFKLRSGMRSSFYLDKYLFESDPKLLSAIVRGLQPLLPREYDRLAGMELGGVPLATGLSLATHKPCLFVRKKAKEYGTCNLVEGGFTKGDTAVVIEDVITTAGQVCTSVKQMRELGLSVHHVFCVIDRQQGGSERLKQIDCSLVSLFTTDELERLSKACD